MHVVYTPVGVLLELLAALMPRKSSKCLHFSLQKLDIEAVLVIGCQKICRCQTFR